MLQQCYHRNPIASTTSFTMNNNIENINPNIQIVTLPSQLVTHGGQQVRGHKGRCKWTTIPMTSGGVVNGMPVGPINEQIYTDNRDSFYSGDFTFSRTMWRYENDIYDIEEAVLTCMRRAPGSPRQSRVPCIQRCRFQDCHLGNNVWQVGEKRLETTRLAAGSRAVYDSSHSLYITASHLCHQGEGDNACVDPDHICYESLAINKGRNGCSAVRCYHNPPCMVPGPHSGNGTMTDLP